jgi:hypothetical protein
MEGGRPYALGTSGFTVPHHGVELGLGQSQEVSRKVTWAVVYWRAGCCADVACSVAVAAMCLLPHTYL